MHTTSYGNFYRPTKSIMFVTLTVSLYYRILYRRTQRLYVEFKLTESIIFSELLLTNLIERCYYG